MKMTELPGNEPLLVYIVEYGVNYESSNVHGVYLSLSEAKKDAHRFKKEGKDYATIEIWDVNANKCQKTLEWDGGLWIEWYNGDRKVLKDSEVK